MSAPTKEYMEREIDEFLDLFETFDTQITKRDKAMYVRTSDRIALFAIGYGR